MSLTIKFYDVEHGNCTHVITPNGKHILIDIGSKSYRSMASYINETYTQDRIDQLIITHPHEDHIFDLPILNELIKPRILQRPKGAFDIKPTQNTALHRQIADCANAMNKEYNRDLTDSEKVILPANNGGVSFEIISPEDNWTDKSNINTFSSLVIINYQGYKFIITGDNPKTILDTMMNENYSDIRSKTQNATALLAPHHGRTGEFSKLFFDNVNPYLTVVSDKCVVHTTQEETAYLYKGRGAKLYGRDRYVLTTRNDGTITFTVSPGNCNVSMGNEY